MATEIPYFARYTSPTAANAELNPVGGDAVEIIFTSVDPATGFPTGNLTLNDFALDDGKVDQDTWVSLDGGISWEQFDVLFHGLIGPQNDKRYDFSSTGGPNFNLPTLITIQLGDGSKLFFFPEEAFTPADMNLFPQGAIDLIADLVNLPPAICFLRGTLIAVSGREQAVEDLKIGDTVMTRDNGPQTISWIGKRSMSGNTPAHLLPVRIKANALGNGLPKRDLLVSPQHRILVSDWRAELMFGASEVLIAAKHLVNDDDIRVATDLDGFEYFHILFESHQTVFSEGLPSESFHPGDFAMKTLPAASRAEVLELFPELADDVASYGPATHTSLKAFEAKALQNA